MEASFSNSSEGETVEVVPSNANKVLSGSCSLSGLSDLSCRASTQGREQAPRAQILLLLRTSS